MCDGLVPETCCSVKSARYFLCACDDAQRSVLQLEAVKETDRPHESERVVQISRAH